MSDANPSSTDPPDYKQPKPVCIIVLGMAGSGKTTFVHRLTSYLNSIQKYVYTINLDPAVHHIPYQANIDIRDTVNFKQVMKQYGFGPNGAIMTSLNFFASQFNKVIDLIHKNSSKVSHVVLDTPGQIEVFTWSASGTIISELLASSFPTLVIYVMDTPRSHNPVTFMSNMLYACSVLYRMQLPFLIALNKTDIIDCGFAIEWMKDFEAFQDALSGHRSVDDGGPAEFETGAYPGTSPYMLGLMNSMSLVLDEFYNDLRCCGVSSVTGDGMDKLCTELEHATREYFEVYLPLVRSRKCRPQGSQIAPGSPEIKHKCSDDCKHPPRVTERLEPLGRQRSMLVDMAGDCDDAEGDAMIDLDGVEVNNSSDEETLEVSVNEQFRRLCAVSPKDSTSTTLDQT